MRRKKVRAYFTLCPRRASIAVDRQTPFRGNVQVSTAALAAHLLAAPLSIPWLSHNAAAITDLRSGSTLRDSSLFQNILPTSPFASRFCQDQAISMPNKPFEINILEETCKK
jgi:hypothetical protein